MHDIDFDAKGNSFLHRLDPKLKLIVSFVVVIAILVSELDRFVIIFPFVLVLSVLSRVPFKRAVERLIYPIFIASIIAAIHPFTYGSSVVFKFYFLKVYSEGIIMAVLIFSRVLASIFVLNLLTMTTSLAELIRGMKQLRIPNTVLVIMPLMLRFIPVFADEGSRIYRAQWSRLGYSGGYTDKMKDYGTLGGKLIIRSMDRALEVYKSMHARGYDSGGD
jgi:energy-coupling factor transport system permease protein